MTNDMISKHHQLRSVIWVTKNTRDQLLQIKINSQAKNINQVIANLLQGLVPDYQVIPIAQNNQEVKGGTQE